MTPHNVRAGFRFARIQTSSEQNWELQELAGFYFQRRGANVKVRASTQNEVKIKIDGFKSEGFVDNATQCLGPWVA